MAGNFSLPIFVMPEINLYFNTTGALLYGRRRVQNYSAASFFATPVQDFTTHRNNVVSSLQFAAGFQWEKIWNPVKMVLKVGYELNFWYNLQEQYTFNLNGPQEVNDRAAIPFLSNNVVSLQGWVAGISFEF